MIVPGCIIAKRQMNRKTFKDASDWGCDTVQSRDRLTLPHMHTHTIRKAHPHTHSINGLTDTHVFPSCDSSLDSSLPIHWFKSTHTPTHPREEVSHEWYVFAYSDWCLAMQQHIPLSASVFFPYPTSSVGTDKTALMLTHQTALMLPHQTAFMLPAPVILDVTHLFADCTQWRISWLRHIAYTCHVQASRTLRTVTHLFQHCHTRQVPLRVRVRVHLLVRLLVRVLLRTTVCLGAVAVLAIMFTHLATRFTL